MGFWERGSPSPAGKNVWFTGEKTGTKVLIEDSNNWMLQEQFQVFECYDGMFFSLLKGDCYSGGSWRNE